MFYISLTISVFKSSSILYSHHIYIYISHSDVGQTQYLDVRTDTFNLTSLPSESVWQNVHPPVFY